MNKTLSLGEKPLIGFFNLFYNFGETCRSVLIAQHYKELGGEVVFFSHGGEYEYLAEDIGCKVVRVNPIYSKEFIDLLWASSRLETFKNPFSEKNVIEHVENEIAAYKKAGVKMIVSTNNFSCYISSRAAGLPLIVVTPKVPASFTRYPDDAEFFFTRLIPQSIKLKVLNWYTPRSRRYVRPFTRVAKKYNISPPRVSGDLFKGDYTFYVDFIEFLGLDKSTISSNEYYVGHCFLDELLEKTSDEKESSKEENKLERHIRKDEKSILLTLGSSGTKDLFLKILHALNKTNYNVVAVYNAILKEEEIPDFNDNILLKKFVPSMAKLNKMVDLVIIHGGKATVYTAAYSGKPAIGYPMQFEQHLNLELIARHRMARLESRKYFKEKKLLEAVKEIFNNYDVYLKNAQTLASKLPKAEGDKKAAEKIFEIVTKTEANV